MTQPATVHIPEMPAIDWSTDVTVAVIVICVITGGLLLWKGLKLSRWMLMLAAGAAGYGISTLVTDHLQNLPPWVASVGFVLVGASLGFLMARFVLALMAGTIVAAGVLYWMVTNNIAEVPSELIPRFDLPPDATALDWAQELPTFAKNYLAEVRKEENYVPLGILVAAGILPVIFALLLKRWAVIFITSLFGAAMLVFAYGLVMKLQSGADPATTLYGPVTPIALVGLTVAGTFLQHVTRKRKKPDDGGEAAG